MKKIPTSVIVMGSLLLGAILITAMVLLANQQALANVTLPVPITEYFDYQCSHCGDFANVLSEVKQKYGDKVEITYRHFPLGTELSQLLAQGAVAAEWQGKFAEYHQTLFAKIDQVRAGTLPATAIDATAIAEELGFDMEKFSNDLQSQEAIDRVASDQSLGIAAGVQGTPAVYIYEQYVVTGQLDPQTNEVVYTSFLDKLDRLVTQAEANEKSEE